MSISLRKRLVGLVIAVPVLVNCGPTQPINQNKTAVTQSSPFERPTEPTEARLRTACATRVLNLLVDAINTRSDASLKQLIAGGPSSSQAFQWVSITAAGVNETEYTADGARQLLLRHSTVGERWTLGTVIATDGPSWHGGVDAEIHLDRRFADGRVAKASGKTALSCLATAIFVLSLADD